MSAEYHNATCELSLLMRLSDLTKAAIELKYECESNPHTHGDTQVMERIRALNDMLVEVQVAIAHSRLERMMNRTEELYSQVAN